MEPAGIALIALGLREYVVTGPLEVKDLVVECLDVSVAPNVAAHRARVCGTAPAAVSACAATRGRT